MISTTKIKLRVVYGAKLGSKIAIKIERKRFISGTFMHFLLNMYILGGGGGDNGESNY